MAVLMLELLLPQRIMPENWALIMLLMLAITSRRFISPEMYYLINSMTPLIRASTLRTNMHRAIQLYLH